ncbi:hypothetical protein FGIG_09999 [Fasciola gigantica]|uniref:Uncharacterized protein n=1 Tax=Fasciola gigantica TaxID=46835 RepID=A0A504Y3V0_FASGI|nr:hypothetical protein FGIG_09999 [Fasciola gigantica]
MGVSLECESSFHTNMKVCLISLTLFLVCLLSDTSASNCATTCYFKYQYCASECRNLDHGVNICVSLCSNEYYDCLTGICGQLPDTKPFHSR